MALKVSGTWPNEKGFNMLAKIEGYAGKGGNVFLGVAATGKDEEYFTLVAPNHDGLEAFWPRLMPTTLPLDTAMVQEVAIVSRPLLEWLIERATECPPKRDGKTC